MTQIISKLFGYLFSIKLPRFIQWQINTLFIKIFNIDMSGYPDIKTFGSLQELFIRKPLSNRQIDQSNCFVLSPTDSTILDFGRIKAGQIINIKGAGYETSTLLYGYNTAIEKTIENGLFFNFYLSPRDYHHFHAPIDIHVSKITHIPGKLYSVKPGKQNKCPKLFTHNQRVVLDGESQGKRVCLVAIGALNVGKIVISKVVTPTKNRNIAIKEHPKPIFYQAGEEMGYFAAGSSVVLIIEDGLAEIDSSLRTNQKIFFGEKIAKIIKHDAQNTR